MDSRRKSNPGKLKITLRLRQETTMTLAWIAERLQMGTQDAFVVNDTKNRPLFKPSGLPLLRAKGYDLVDFDQAFARFLLPPQ